MSKEKLTWSCVLGMSPHAKISYLKNAYPVQYRSNVAKMIENSGVEKHDLLFWHIVLDGQKLTELDALKGEVRRLREQLQRSKSKNQSREKAVAIFDEVKGEVTKLSQENKKLKLQNEQILEALKVMINKPSTLILLSEWLTKKIAVFKQKVINEE